MSVLDPPDAYGYTVFCDDIRVEVGNKFTFVGVYPGQFVLYADALPVAIPKLAMSVNLQTTIRQSDLSGSASNFFSMATRNTYGGRSTGAFRSNIHRRS